MVHGCMVYTERAKTAAVSCDTSHVSAVSAPLKMHYKKLFTFVESHASAVSAWAWKIALHKSDLQQQ